MRKTARTQLIIMQVLLNRFDANCARDIFVCGSDRRLPAVLFLELETELQLISYASRLLKFNFTATFPKSEEI